MANHCFLVNTTRPILAVILPFLASLVFAAGPASIQRPWSGTIWMEMDETECECEYGC